MFSDVKNFVLENLWRPIVRESVPAYNIYNTLVYAFLFAASIIYIVIPILEKLDVNYDREFFIALGPWIILGGITAPIELTGNALSIISQPIVIIPSLLTAALASIKIGKKLEEMKNLAYTKTVFTTGLLLSLIALTFHSIENFQALRTLATITVLWLIPGLLFLRTFFPRFFSAELIFPVVMHYMDATTTVVALRLGGYEQHIVARYFIDMLGPYGIFVLKSIVILPAVLMIREKTEGREKLFYLFLVSALGLGIAVRNLLQIF